MMELGTSATARAMVPAYLGRGDLPGPAWTTNESRGIARSSSHHVVQHNPYLTPYEPSVRFKFVKFLVRFLHFAGEHCPRIPAFPALPCRSASPGLLPMSPPPFIALVLILTTVFRIAEACSSRSTPKPRPPSPTMRPNITFQTYACPEAYAKWYCLNGATCFSVKIGESILYNCECADGYMGQRCEFKDLDGSYLPSREKVMIETASIAGGVTVAILLIVFISIIVYIYVKQRKKEKRISSKGISEEELLRKPFSTRQTLRRNNSGGGVRPTTDPESGRLGRTIPSSSPSVPLPSSGGVR